MRFFLTNDDGINAPGIRALHDVLVELGEVEVVAPSGPQSASGHAATFHKPVSVQYQSGTATELAGHAVGGKPADCVKIGLAQLIKEPVDVVVSGMNAGANVGVNVNYSGTVAAAREAAIAGIPAIAVSLHIGDWHAIQWGKATGFVKQILNQVFQQTLVSGQLLNINLPILDQRDQPEGLRVVPLSLSPLVDQYEHSQDAMGMDVYTAHHSMRFREHVPHTDVSEIYAGYATLTPIQLDATDHATLEGWSQWFDGKARQLTTMQ